MSSDVVGVHALASYRRVVALREPGSLSALLHIGQEETLLIMGNDAEPLITESLTIGLRKSVRDFFPRSEVGALEIEYAIAGLEDKIMPLAPRMVHGARLFTTDAITFEIAAFSGIPLASTMQLSRSELEVAFDRWTRTALVGSATMRDVPPAGDLAAGILILRELLHHLYFESLIIADLSGDGPLP